MEWDTKEDDGFETEFDEGLEEGNELVHSAADVRNNDVSSAIVRMMMDIGWRQTDIVQARKG